jgi:hypothetical protein
MDQGGVGFCCLLYGSSTDGLELISRLHDANPFTRRAIINALNALAF